MPIAMQDGFAQRLLRQGIVSGKVVDQAVAASKRNGTTVAAELVGAGEVTEAVVYAVRASEWGAPILDPANEPPEAELLGEASTAERIKTGWAPWRRAGHDGLVVVTTVPPTRGLVAAVKAETGCSTIFLRTIAPRDFETAIAVACRTQLLYAITDRHADAYPFETARPGLAWWQKAFPLVLIPSVLVAATIWTAPVIITIFMVGNAAFYLFVLFKAYLGLRAPMRVLQRTIWERALRDERKRAGLTAQPLADAFELDDDALPVYTILVPAYKEANVIGKLVDSLARLDYPKSKLQVLLLLEEDDIETIAAARASNPPPYVTVLVVPDGKPRTKPRACNYGLEFARGEYVVIFDAEDRPDPGQLRAAVSAFIENRFMRSWVDPATPPLACVQAALAYFNSDYNLLTRLFSIEYAHWFDAMLPGMDGAGLPIPLGGTSNHFRTELLRELGGWDPYNVTEDADLGMRIANRGYAVGTIASSTQEEACAETFAWIKQRTRWIKGYMITAAVQLRHPIEFLRRSGPGGVMTMGLLVAGTPISFMLFPISLLFTLATWLGVQFGNLQFPNWLLQLSLGVMVLGMAMLIVSSAAVAWRRYGWRVAMYAPLIPVYWLLHSLAAWRAAYQAIFSPHQWEKTPHGLTADYTSGGQE